MCFSTCTRAYDMYVGAHVLKRLDPNPQQTRMGREMAYPSIVSYNHNKTDVLKTYNAMQVIGCCLAIKVFVGKLSATGWE